jgi:hypothetical protein
MKRALLFLPALALAIMFVGCDQNDFEDDFDIPGGDAQRFVQVDEDIADSIQATFRSGASNGTGMTLEVPISALSDVTIDFEIVGADPSNITIADVDVNDTTGTDTIEVRIPTTIGGVDTVIVRDSVIVTTERYTVTYDDATGTGTAVIGYSPNRTLVDFADFVIDRTSTTLTAAQEATFRITDASDEDGNPLTVGRLNAGAERTLFVGGAEPVAQPAAGSDLDFGTVDTGSEAFITVQVRNRTLTTGAISSIDVKNGTPAFSIVGPSALPADLGVDGDPAVPIEIRFAPGQNEAVFADTLVVTYDGNPLADELTFPLAGEGVAP